MKFLSCTQNSTISSLLQKYTFFIQSSYDKSQIFLNLTTQYELINRCFSSRIGIQTKEKTVKVGEGMMKGRSTERSLFYENMPTQGFCHKPPENDSFQ